MDAKASTRDVCRIAEDIRPGPTTAFLEGAVLFEKDHVRFLINPKKAASPPAPEFLQGQP